MRKIEITTLKLNYIVYWKERRGAHLDKLILCPLKLCITKDLRLLRLLRIWCVIRFFLTRQCTSDYVISPNELVLRKCSLLQVHADTRPADTLLKFLHFLETEMVSKNILD